MEWYTNIEQQRQKALFILILLAVAVLAVTSLRDNRSYDSYWHLKIGQDWVENDLSPWRDNYSFTYPGSAVDSPPILFEAGLYGLSRTLGTEAAFKVFKFVSTLLVLGMSLWWMKRIRAPVLVYWLVLPLLLFSLQTRDLVRPELISYSLSILALILYHRALSGVTVSNMLPVVFLMLAWTNYHSSIVGYVLFFGLFVDLGIRQISDHASKQVWVRWALWGGLVVAVGFINPSFSHPAIAMLNFPSEWKVLINEYHSPIRYLNVPATYILILVAAGTIVQLLRLRLFGLAIACVILVFNAWFLARMVAPAAVVVVCVFAHVLGRMDVKALLTQTSAFKRWVLTGLILIIVFVPLAQAIQIARALVEHNSGLKGYFPDALVAYLKETGQAGRIFNEYALGGYLIYSLAPESSVYIDGRTEILYPVNHLLQLQASKRLPDVMKAEIEKYDIDYAILQNTSDNANLMANTGLMKLDFADIRYFLYSREDANFPVSGVLWGKPYCWDEGWGDALVREQLTALMLLPPESPLLPFLETTVNYSAAEDKGRFIGEARDTTYWMDSTRRFAGYRALELGMYEQAESFFSSIWSREAKDFLAEALALLRAGKEEEAVRMIDQAREIKWFSLEMIDLVIMQGLLQELSESRPLNPANADYLDELTERVGAFALGGQGMRASAATFCVGDE